MWARRHASSLDDGAADGEVEEIPLPGLTRSNRSCPAHLIGFVELCERFSYNGTAAVFISFLCALPSSAAAAPCALTGVNPSGTSGALGLGTNAATAITQFNMPCVYVIPLFGAYVPDSRLGRFRTVCYSVGIAMAGHIMMILCTLPSIIIRAPLALTVFITALLVMGLGTGGFKSNISPLVGEQQRGPARMTVVRDADGERVILDPAIRTARIYVSFYCIQYMGLLPAFTLPTILFSLRPFVLWYGHMIYTKSPPEGSVLRSFLCILHLTSSPFHTTSLHQARVAWHNPQVWERGKPRVSVPLHAGHKPRWMVFDDDFVEEGPRRVLAERNSSAQMNDNMTSQAATKTTNGVPNDVINNTNPIALMVLIPVFDAFAMVWVGILQWYVYTTYPSCGYGVNDLACGPSPISVWWQTGSYVLMIKSVVVMALFLSTSAFVSVTGEMLNPLVGDPVLVWNYVVCATLSFVAGNVFWISVRKLDVDEDCLNEIGYHVHKNEEVAEEEALTNYPL
ncbi:hypothetical protein CALVIDRAFT_551658 [Calocera viscosa TUFC12733]|uniref:PTR2-domain-containing protein n=2 Tax=Calocera viscosa (strain TUFC12733) TaxID=1330018 RepID=A0A167G709_CALVF|nr:hypothetical protein CALVIDRAFT_551658 [Calocera viscosa TUFC12733]